MSGHGGLVAVISGPSGVGKTTVVDGLLRKRGYARSITATTRPPRPGEVDGRHYRFLTRKRFEREVAEGRFLEHAVVHGNLYGTPRDGVESVLARGLTCLLNIDVQGAESMRRTGLPVVTVFLLPPSMRELGKRLAKRGTEDPREVERRIAIARREVEQAGRFDARVVNRSVKRTVEAVARFLERRRRSRPAGARAKGRATEEEE
jgi:guanylate kinase